MESQHTLNAGELSIVNGEKVVEKGRLTKIKLDELVSSNNRNSAKLYAFLKIFLF